jgi:hypothetical protein
MSIENDIDNLSKWLNEDIVSDIDRKALARVLGHLRYPPAQPTPVQEPVQDRTPWIFRDRRGEKYTPKDQTYTPQEAAISAMILDHESIGPAWLNAPTPQDAQPAVSSNVWQDLRNRIQADIDRPEGRWGMHGHYCIDDDYFIALEWVVERMDEILKNPQLATVYGEPK